MATYINQTQMAAAASAAASPLVNFPMNLGKDSRWLTLEVCREFQRTRCTRTDLECKFAHPPPHVEIQNGRVTCCFDSIKGKCSRKEPPCKYLHPPQHLKEQLLQNGRNNLLARQQFQNIYTTPHMPIAAQPITQLAYDSLASRVNPSAVPYNPAAAAGVAAGLVHAAGHSYVMASPYAQFSHLGAGAALPVSNGYAAYGGVAMQNALTAACMGYSPMTSVAVGPTSGSSVTTMAGSDLGGQLAPLNMPPVSSPSPVSVGGSAQSLTPKRADRLESAVGPSAAAANAPPSAAAAQAQAQAAAMAAAHQQAHHQAQQLAAVQAAQVAAAAQVQQQAQQQHQAQQQAQQQHQVHQQAQQHQVQQQQHGAAAVQAAQAAQAAFASQHQLTTQEYLATQHQMAAMAAAKKRPREEDLVLQALPGMGMPMVKRPAMEGKAGMPMFPYHAAAYPQFIHPQPAAGYGHLAFAGHPPGMPRF